ncbi:MAG: Gx transporter family protein [Elusimicrobia bacterium]|jgi:heptaprenyl diphosphate synthase|nr:Gx transporter family protein [Elusimicrobiota bacterium]
MLSRNKNIVYIALFIAAASALQITEWMLPNPIPAVKLGLANMVTLIALILYGPKSAFWVAAGRTIFSSIIIGTFLSPAFVLSFSGAVTSAGVMVLLYRPLGKLSPVGVSISGAVVHNSVQVLLVYLLFIRHPGIMFILPVLLVGAVITGSLNGYLAKKIAPRLAEFSPRRIYLASSSPRRKDMLEKAGLPVTVIFPGEVFPGKVEETPRPQEDPKKYARRQAENKIKAVYKNIKPPGCVISGDTVVACGGEIFLKPGTIENAEKMLIRLNGRRQEVITAVVLKELSTGRIYKKTVSTVLKLREFSRADIIKFSREHYDKAGGYAIQGMKDKHIEYIKGSYSNVVGFPVGAVRKLLKKACN